MISNNPETLFPEKKNPICRCSWVGEEAKIQWNEAAAREWLIAHLSWIYGGKILSIGVDLKTMHPPGLAPQRIIMSTRHS